MGAARMEWRKFAGCMLAMTACAAVSGLIAIDHPRHAWICGWIGMWAYVRVERLFERAP